MIELYGIQFPDDELQPIVLDGQPDWALNRKGVRRLAEHAPNREAAAKLLAYLDSLDEQGAG